MDIDLKLNFNRTKFFHAEYSNKGSLIGPISFWCANIEEKWFDYYETEPPNDVVFLGVRWKSRYFFFAKDVAPRWASNHGPFHGNYRDKCYLTPGDGQLHANLR